MVQWPLVCVISAYLVAFGAHFIKVVEDVVIKKFTFAPSSPDEFLFIMIIQAKNVSRASTSLCHK